MWGNLGEDIVRYVDQLDKEHYSLPLPLPFILPGITRPIIGVSKIAKLGNSAKRAWGPCQYDRSSFDGDAVSVPFWSRSDAEN
jgi:hypothetical protein